MANRIGFYATMFTDMIIPNDEVSFGFRATDDYISYYDNTWMSHEAEVDDLTLLATIITKNKAYSIEAVTDLLEHMYETELGCLINSNWYEWHQIQHLFSK